MAQVISNNNLLLQYLLVIASGGIGVEILGQIAGYVSTALANKENLEALHERATELLVRVRASPYFDVPIIRQRSVGSD